MLGYGLSQGRYGVEPKVGQSLIASFSFSETKKLYALTRGTKTNKNIFLKLNYLNSRGQYFDNLEEFGLGISFLNLGRNFPWLLPKEELGKE